MGRIDELREVINKRITEMTSRQFILEFEVARIGEDIQELSNLVVKLDEEHLKMLDAQLSVKQLNLKNATAKVRELEHKLELAEAKIPKKKIVKKK